MQSIKIKANKNSINPNDFPSSCYNCICLNSHSLLIALNLLFSLYLFLLNKKNNILIQELIKANSNRKINEQSLSLDLVHLNYTNEKIDMDMIGLKYPEVYFDKFKSDLNNGKFISNFYNFLTQLETKLIYLEKEINVTKINAFYTARTLYLEKKKVNYDDSKITKFHEIMSWLVIHKSTQLKGIASDKFLACNYVKIKIGKDLCPHRIGVFNSFEEINFENLIKMKNVVLKVSNGCHDNVYITEKNTINDIDRIKKNLLFHFNREYSFIVPEFFHLFSKKRIVLEKLFIPKSDLYEFRFFIFNHKINMCMLSYYRNHTDLNEYFDENFNKIKEEKNLNLSINIFKKEHLDELKSLAIKLSEDFPNFIRVDLYLFQNKIYLSELTFDSNSGIPMFTDITYFNDAIKKWKRIDY